MNTIANTIKQRLSLREPLGEALDVLTRLVDKLSLSKPERQSDKEAEAVAYEVYLKEQLQRVKEVCPYCKDFERDFPSCAFSIATGIGKTRLMGLVLPISIWQKASGISSFWHQISRFTRS